MPQKILMDTGMENLPDSCIKCVMCDYGCRLPMKLNSRGSYTDAVKKAYMSKRHEECPLKCTEIIDKSKFNLDDELEDIIIINFSYNGNLGTLQYKTQNNLEFLRRVYTSNLISNESYISYKEQIIDYFKQEMKKVASNCGYYLW